MKRALLLTLLVSTAARAETLAPRDTAWTRAEGHYSVGVFNPLRYALTDRVELETHPLFFLFAPNATARIPHAEIRGIQLTGEYGLSLPKGGLDLLRRRAWGLKLPEPVMFLPTWFEGMNHVGWFLQPEAGLLASGRIGSRAVWTGKVDLAVGVPLTEDSATPLDSMLAPLNLATAPALTGFRAHVGGLYDRSLLDWLRLRTELNAYMVGTPPEGYVAMSRFTFSAGVALDLAVGKHSRVTAGVMWFNHDTHEKKISTGDDGFSRIDYVRNNDFLPTIDFIWAG